MKGKEDLGVELLQKIEEKHPGLHEKLKSEKAKQDNPKDFFATIRVRPNCY